MRRGWRRLDAHTVLTFKYHVTRTGAVRVQLRDRKAVRGKPANSMPGVANAWAEETLIFPRVGTAVDEIRFMLPKGNRPTIDDLLLYESGDWPE